MNEITTLILAWRMAQAYGEDESTAIQGCASRMCKNIDIQNVRILFMQLASKTATSEQRIKAVKRLEIGLKVEGML